MSVVDPKWNEPVHSDDLRPYGTYANAVPVKKLDPVAHYARKRGYYRELKEARLRREARVKRKTE